MFFVSMKLDLERVEELEVYVFVEIRKKMFKLAFFKKKSKNENLVLQNGLQTDTERFGTQSAE